MVLHAQQYLGGVSYREWGEDIGEENYAIGFVIPPRLKGDLRRHLRDLRPLPKGGILQCSRVVQRGPIMDRTTRKQAGTSPIF